METFRLWHDHYDPATRTFSVYATAVNTQGFNMGTDAMVSQMLADIEVAAKPVAWKLRRFMTDYISDAEEDDVPEDRWLETAELEIRTDAPVRRHLPFPGIGFTTACDETWKADSALPDTLVVVVDFKRSASARKAIEVVNVIGALRGQSEMVDAITSRFRTVPKKDLTELAAPAFRGVSAEASFDPLQGLVSIPRGGTLDEAGERA